ncbi:MAG: hypothetical protein N2445_05105, partial [Acidobacteria bacterium]|nr:hypothetical protein [Acidobacteriota bacterium]
MKKNKLYHLLIIALLLSVSAIAEKNFIDNKASEWLLKAYENRKDLNSLSYLSSEYSLWNDVSPDEVLPILDKIISAQDLSLIHIS